MSICSYTEIAMNLIKMLKSLADETRLRIVILLAQGEMCVCELEHILGTTQSNVSKHLEKLLSAGIVEQNKKAQWIYYRISENLKKEFPFIKDLLEKGCCAKSSCCDLKILKKYRQRGSNCAELKKAKLAGGTK